MMKLLNNRKADGSYVLANLRIIAITDGPAAVYDPAGINREEISRLVHTAALDGFDPAKLTGEGAFMIWSAADADGMHRMVTVADGKNTEKLISHNEFMSLFSNNIFREADVFIPGGGRPQTIHDGNWTNYVPAGKPLVKAIVEGANSFTTPSARLKLQAAGIVNVLDSSANKCGVITSSYEILSGILLEKDEFIANKEAVVAELMDKLALCANKEAEWLYKEFIARKNVPMTDLSNELGNTVNELKSKLFDLFTEKPELLADQLILEHLLPIFRTKFADRIARIPDLYRKAIGAAEAAGRIVYTPEDPAVADIIKALAK
jgi:glutamate dehydrogenase